MSCMSTTCQQNPETAVQKVRKCHVLLGHTLLRQGRSQPAWSCRVHEQLIPDYKNTSSGWYCICTRPRDSYICTRSLEEALELYKYMQYH